MDKAPRPVRTILVGTGLTTESVGGVLMARELAGRFGAALHAAHVIDPVPAEQEAAIPGLSKAHEEHAREELELYARSHGLTGPDVTLHVAVGAPDAELLGLVGKLGADLLVMGRYGRGGVRRGSLGSVADRVVRKCPASVLVVDPVFRGSFRSIGVASDFSPESEIGINRALDLAQLHGIPEVLLLHAYELPRGYHRIMTHEQASARIEEVAQARADSVRQRLGAGDGRPRLSLRLTEGPVGTAVPELALREKLDLLVVNTHGRSLAAMYMLERKTEKILHSTACSVWAERSPEMHQGLAHAVERIISG